MELKKILDEYDRVFQESKQIINRDINEFCNSTKSFNTPSKMVEDIKPIVKNSLTSSNILDDAKNQEVNTVDVDEHHDNEVNFDEIETIKSSDLPDINKQTCGCEKNGKDGQFCNYEDNTIGTCESCNYYNNADECENDGLPDKGALDCKRRCFNNFDDLVKECNDTQIKNYMTDNKPVTHKELCGVINNENGKKCNLHMASKEICDQDIIDRSKTDKNVVTKGNGIYIYDKANETICLNYTQIKKCEIDDIEDFFKSDNYDAIDYSPYRTYLCMYLWRSLDN